MSLQRKEDNLRKAQTRLDRIQNPPRWKVISHLKNREFQIDFCREQMKSGKFRTRAYIIRDAKAYHGNNRGVVHKAVNKKLKSEKKLNKRENRLKSKHDSYKKRKKKPKSKSKKLGRKCCQSGV